MNRQAETGVWTRSLSAGRAGDRFPVGWLGLSPEVPAAWLGLFVLVSRCVWFDFLLWVVGFFSFPFITLFSHSKM